MLLPGPRKWLGLIDWEWVLAAREWKIERVLRFLLGFGERDSSARRKQRGKRPLLFENLEARLVPATHSWTGGGGNANWSTAANWADSAPAANENGAAIVFDTSTSGFTAFSSTNNVAGLTNVTLSINDASSAGDFSITLSNAISLASGSSLSSTVSSGTGATIGGSGTVTLAGNATASSSSGTLTVSNPVATAGNTLTVSGSGNTAFSGTISGTGGLSKSGAGTLTVSGASTYSGGSALSAGTLIVARATTGTVTSGPLGTGTLTVSGGTLRADGTARTLSNSVSITGDAAIGDTGGAALTLSGAVSTTGNRSLTFNTTTSVLSGPVSLGGNLTIGGGGGVTLSGGIGLGGSDRTLTINTSGATATLGGPLGSSSSGNTLFLAGSKDLTFNALNAGTSATGTNAITLDVNDSSRSYTFGGSSGTFAGTTHLRAGTIVVNATSPFGATSATLQLSGGTVRTSGSTARTVGQNLAIDGSTTMGAASPNNGAMTFSGSSQTVTNSNTIALAGGNVSFTTATLSLASGSNTTFSGSGPTLTLSGGLNTNGGSDTLTFNTGSAAATLSGAFTGTASALTIAGSGTNIVVGALTGGTAHSLVLDNVGKATLNSGSSTYSGGTTIQGGDVAITANSTPSTVGSTVTSGPLGTGSVAVVGTTTLRSAGNGTTTLANALSFSGGTVTFASTTTIGSSLVLNGPVSVSGTPTLSPTMNGSASHGLTIGALLTLNSDLVVAGDSTGARTFSGGLSTGAATRTITVNNTAGSFSLSGALTGSAGTLVLAGSTTNGTIGALTGNTAHAVEVAGGTWKFNGAAGNYTGGTTIHDADVSATANSTGTWPTVSSGPFGTGALAIQNATFRSSGNGSITLANAVNWSGANAVASTTGIGTSLTLTGPVGVSGSTTIDVNLNGSAGSVLTVSGLLTLSGNLTFGGTSSSAITVSGGIDLAGGNRTIAANGSSNAPKISGALADSVGSGTTLSLAGSGNISVGPLSSGSNAPGLVVNSTTGGTATFSSSASNFTGGTTIASGVAVVAANSTSTTTWAASTARAAGVNIVPTTPNGRFYEVTTAGTSGSSQPSFASAVTPGDTLVDGSITYTVRATPTGPLGTGAVVINGGTLRANGSYTLTSTPLALGPASGSGDGAIDVGSGGSLTINGVLQNNGAGTGNLVKSGAGTLTLGGTLANTFGGSTTVSGGTLRLNKTAGVNAIGGSLSVTGGTALVNVANQIPDPAAVSVTGSGVLKLAASETIQSISGNGTIDASGGSPILTVGDATNQSFSGLIQNTSGSLGLTKVGSGRLTLSGSNTYTGPTLVSAGELELAGSGYATGTGTVTIAEGAVLSGNRSIGGTLIVAGEYDFGTSPSILTTAGFGYSATGSRTVSMLLGGPTSGSPIAGVDYDQFAVNGTVDVSGTTLDLRLGGHIDTGDTFTIFDNDGSDAVIGVLRNARGKELREGETIGVGYNNFTISYAGGNGNDIVLTAVATPAVSFYGKKLSASEEARAYLVVELTSMSSSSITVTVATADDTATNGVDYTGTSQVVTFAPDQTRAIVPVRILQNATDDSNDPPRTFKATLSAVSGARIERDDEVTVSIVDDETDTTNDPTAELLINGSFERKVVTHSSGWDIFADDEVPGWVLETGPSFEFHKQNVVGVVPNDGAQYLELDADVNGHSGIAPSPEHGQITIYQDVATYIGQSYTLTYWLRARPGVTSDDNVLRIQVMGTYGSIVDTTRTGTADWVKYEESFVATHKNTRIWFGDQGSLDNTSGTFLDNVSLKADGPAPENNAPVAVDDPDGIAAAWWQFDENTGAVATDLMANLSARLPTGVTWSSDVAGAFTGGASLDFSAAVGPVTTDPFDLRTGDFTVAFWIKWSSVSDGNLVGQDDGNSNSWELRLSSGSLQFRVSTESDGDKTPIEYAFSPSTATWYHVALTRYDDDWTLYVNGDDVASANDQFDFPAVGEIPLQFGASSFSGKLDSLLLARRALNSAMIADLFDGAYSPVAAYDTNEDTPLTIERSELLSNDSDIEEDEITLVNYTQPKFGEVTLNFATGDFVYTPTAGYHGPDTFTYTISDGNGGYGTASVYIAVASVNDAPVAADDFWSTEKNANVTISARSNDSDLDGDALTITQVSSTSIGSGVTLTSGAVVTLVSGDLVYTPATNFTGFDSFTYTISDGNGGTDTAAVTVYVAETGQWATSVIAADASWNFSPYDWLAVQALGTPNTHEYGDFGTAWAPRNENPEDSDPPTASSTITLGFAIPDEAATGLLIYETYGTGFVTRIDVYDGSIWHDDVWEGEDETTENQIGILNAAFNATYNVSQVRIWVSLGNDSDAWEEIDAVKLIGSVAGEEDAPPTLEESLIETDAEEDGTYELLVASNLANEVDYTAGHPFFITITAQPSSGFVEIDFKDTPDDPIDDRLVYTPGADFEGTVTFSYKATDIWGQFVVGTISLNVTVNAPPTLASETFATTSKGIASDPIDILAGASDIGDDPLSISKINAESPSGGVELLSGAVVTVVDGKLIYTPDTDFVGRDSFTVEISDGDGGTTTGTVFVIVYPTGQWATSVIASTQYGSTDWSASQALGAPDTFYLGDSATAWAPLAADGSTQTLTASFDIANGTGVIIRQPNGGGFITKIEVYGASGLLDTFDAGVDFTETLAAGHLADFTVSFGGTITGVTSVMLYVNTNAILNDWEEIDAVRLLTGPDPVTTGSNFDNTAPEAANLFDTAETDVQLIVRPLDVGFDPDGDALTITVGSASHGTAAVDNNGTPTDPSDDFVTYLSNSGYEGADSFTFTLSDGHGGSVTKTVSLDVHFGIYAGSFVTASSQNAGSYAIGSGLDAIGTTATAPGGWSPSVFTGSETLTLAFAKPTVAASFLIREGGSEGFVTKLEIEMYDDFLSEWVWSEYWSGTDATDPADNPYFMIDEGTTAGVVRAVRITVDAAKDGRIDAIKLISSASVANVAPTVDTLSVTTSEDIPVNLNLTYADGDGDSLILSFTSPAHGYVVLDVGITPDHPSDDYLRYVPDADYSGSDSFDVTVTDPFGRTATATVTITVSAVNDAPVAAEHTVYTGINTGIVIDPLATDSDPETDGIQLDSVTYGAHGIVDINNAGTPLVFSDDYLVYTPTTGYTGPDAFTYRLVDEHGAATTGYVSVIVTGSGQWANAVLAQSSNATSASEALGSPNDLAGDAAHSWSPTSSNLYEFLTVGFASAAPATGLIIHQSASAGLIRGIELLEGDGTPHLIWVGTDSSSGYGLGSFNLDFEMTIFDVAAVRIFVDGQSGTPQIDAVQLLDDGSAAETIQSSWSHFTGQSVERIYDESGRIETENVVTRGVLSQSTELEYDGEALETKTVTDALGRKTRTTFDEDGRTLTQTLAYDSADAATTAYDYDIDGNLILLTDPVPNETEWDYSVANEVTESHDAIVNGSSATVTSTRTFDSKGRLASIRDANDRLRTFEYDEAGRKHIETWYDGPTDEDDIVRTFTWTYTASGQIATAVDDDGVTTSAYVYTYDSQNRLIQVEEPVTITGDVPFTLRFGYDEYGHRNLIVDNLGTRQESLYSPSGQLLRRITTNGSDVLRIDQVFNANGQLVEQRRYSDAAGTQLVATTTYTYDPWTGQTTSIISTDDEETVLSQFEYEYDLTGQITLKREYQLGFDVTPESFTPLTELVETLYDYDDQGQLTQDGDIDLDYDANGNREDVDDTTYVTDGYNQLLSDETWDYTYDAEGNLTGKAEIGGDDTWTYVYDHANHLISVQYSDGAGIDLQVDYKYDVWGNRIGKMVDDDRISPSSPVTTQFAIDGWNTMKAAPVGNENYDAWADINADGSLKTHYVRGDGVDELIGRIDAGDDAYWYYTDNLGSIRHIVNSDGDLVDSLSYDAFGNILTETDAAYRGRYAWTGREIEVEVDLQFNRARFYDPSIGRWISKDPMGFDAGDSNLYRYVKNAPTNHTDPSGFQTTGGVDANEKLAKRVLKLDGHSYTVYVKKNTIDGDGKKFIEIGITGPKDGNISDFVWFQMIRSFGNREGGAPSSAVIAIVGNGLYQPTTVPGLFDPRYLDGNDFSTIAYNGKKDKQEPYRTAQKYFIEDSPSIEDDPEVVRSGAVANSYLVYKGEIVYDVHWERIARWENKKLVSDYEEITGTTITPEWVAPSYLKAKTLIFGYARKSCGPDSVKEIANPFFKKK